MKNLIPLIFVLLVSCTNAQKSKYYGSNNIAIDGYDVVSYFENKPVKGDEKFSYVYEDFTFYFSSASHLESFKAEPIKFLPQYGGYCAYAMAKNGKAVKVDPKTYEIRDGKLYLFYNFRRNNTLDSWLEEQPENLIIKANSYWKRFLNKRKK